MKILHGLDKIFTGLKILLDLTNFSPVDISEYEFSQLLPEDFKSSLPTIEETGNEMKDVWNGISCCKKCNDCR